MDVVRHRCTDNVEWIERNGKFCSKWEIFRDGRSEISGKDNSNHPHQVAVAARLIINFNGQEKL